METASVAFLDKLVTICYPKRRFTCGVLPTQLCFPMPIVSFKMRKMVLLVSSLNYFTDKKMPGCLRNVAFTSCTRSHEAKYNSKNDEFCNG